MLFWQSVKDSANPAAFQAYLQQYPNGPFATLARLKLEELKPTKIAALAPATKPAISLEPIGGSYVALRNANVRAAPTLDARKITMLAKGSTIHVAGKVASKKVVRRA